MWFSVNSELSDFSGKDMRRTDPVLGHFKSTLQIAAVKIVERRVGERW